MSSDPCSLIQIDEVTLKESVSHITPEFPYVTNLDNLHTYPESCFPWHWHNEVEFFYMRHGTLDYHLPSGVYTFREGEGGFVNSNILHMTRSKDALPCVLEEHIFLPEFIGGHPGSVLLEKYILPITCNPSFELYRFDLTKEKDRQIIPLLRQAFDLYNSKEPFYEFKIRETLTQIWMLIFEIVSGLKMPIRSAVTSERIKNMMSFIAAHYSEKITLEQIAESGFISIRECCRCFQENLGQTPFSYLSDYRLRRSCDLLLNTDLSITTISTTCGFGRSSYFGKLFREKFHCSPREFRSSGSPGISSDPD